MRHDAINNLYPEVHNQIDNECFDIKGNPVSVDEDKVQTEIARLKAEYDSQAYARARQPLYPDIGDQLDDLYHKGAFSADMAAKIKKVKDDNPKG